MKITKMTSFAENVTEKPDMSKSDIFVTKNMKNSHFRQKPLGLYRGLWSINQGVLLVVSLWCQWCQKTVIFAKAPRIG